MPKIVKKSSSSKLKVSSKAKDSASEELMEFEQFIAKKKGIKKPKKKGFVFFALIILIIALSLILFTDNSKPSAQHSYTYKTIYLESGQQLYAKVIKEDALYIYIDDVFYTKAEKVEVPAEEEGGEPQLVERTRLVARGQELNSPVGLMQINRAKVFAIDNMGENSEILKMINEIKAQQ